MGLKSLIFFSFMVMRAVSAFYPAEDYELSRIPPEVNFDSVEDLLIDALTSEIESKISSAADITLKDKDTQDESKPKMQTSESHHHEAIWPDREFDSSSSMEDPDENDALYSRDYRNSNKRDDYYQGLEKKSQRSTYIPPPRKTFYDPPEVIDGSASEEYIPEVRTEERRPPRMADYDDYNPNKDSLTDVIQSGSRHMVDSLDVAPSKEMYNSRPMQTPPWRFMKGKSYPRQHESPVPVNEQAKSTEGYSRDSLLPRAPVLKSHGTFKMAQSPPRRQSARYPPPPKIHYNDESKFKSLPRSKPWMTEYSKAPVAPKLAAQEDRVFMSSAGGRATRQQFHEQGTRGPHSYKFGYNTGDKNNPMARYEERDSDGMVRGSYSYVDARGSKQTVHYESHPKFGFKSKLSSEF